MFALRYNPTLACFLVSVILAGCSSGPASIAPQGLAPGDIETIRSWTNNYVNRGARRYEIRPWRFRNEQGAAAGRAAVVIAPPDSLRFDYQGPFRRSGRAAVVGDSALWVVPEEDFRGLVSLAPLFWAGLGIPQPPQPGTQVYTFEQDGVRAWRYIVAGDTLNFVLRGDPASRLTGEIRRQGRTIGLVDARLDPSTGYVTRAQIDLPIDVSRFEFTITDVEDLETIDSDIWKNR